MKKIAIGLICLASVNWWVLLIAWTWFGKNPTENMLAANGLTSFFILLAGFIAWGYHDMRNTR